MNLKHKKSVRVFIQNLIRHKVEGVAVSIIITQTTLS